MNPYFIDINLLSVNFILSVFGFYFLIIFFTKKSILDNPCKRKTHKNPTPTSGGLIFFIPLIIFALSMKTSSSDLILVAIASIFIIVGFIDDRLDLSPRLKFLIQIILVSIMILEYGSFSILETLFGESSWLNFSISLVIIVGLINAFNLIDGSDGFAGIYAIIVLIISSIISYSQGDYNVLLLSLLLGSCLLAFLVFNVNPAKIFMGDSGSLTIGFLLAFIALKTGNSSHALNNQSNYILLPLLLIPSIDTVRVMIWRIIRGKKPFNPDRTHIHHILLKIGLSVNATALTFAVISILTILSSWALYSLGYTLIKCLFLSTGFTTLLFGIAVRLLQVKRKHKIKEEKEKIIDLKEANYLLN